MVWVEDADRYPNIFCGRLLYHGICTLWSNRNVHPFRVKIVHCAQSERLARVQAEMKNG